MKCEICNKKEATQKMKFECVKKTTVKNVCSDCGKMFVVQQIQTFSDELLNLVKEELFTIRLTTDLPRLNRLLDIYHHHLDFELMKSFQDAGLQKDLEKLSNKAGKILEKKEK